MTSSLLDVPAMHLVFRHAANSPNGTRGMLRCHGTTRTGPVHGQGLSKMPPEPVKASQKPKLEKLIYKENSTD
jgi:hypothetical protein